MFHQRYNIRCGAMCTCLSFQKFKVSKLKNLRVIFQVGPWEYFFGMHFSSKKECVACSHGEPENDFIQYKKFPLIFIESV